MKTPSAAILDVTDQTFEVEVLERSKTVPVVVDFWAPWCGPCRMIGPVLDRLAGEAGGAWILAKVNTDENPGLSQALQISSIPLVVAFKDGRIVDEFMGAQPEPVIRDFLARLAPTLVDGDGAPAEASTPPVLAGAPPDGPPAPPPTPEEAAAAAEAAAHRAEIEARMAASGDIAGLERSVATNPGDLGARLELGKSLAAAGRHGEAFEQFLEVVRRNRAFQEDAGRRAMLDLFELLGHQHPMTERYRRELAGVLFA